MTDRPDQFPDFALDDRIDPIANTPNVVTPDSEKIQFGWAFGATAPMNIMNWIHRYTGLWLHYLDERLNKPESYGVATAPSASTRGAGAMIYVTDEIGGSTLAFSDGSNWRRTSDRAIISLI